MTHLERKEDLRSCGEIQKSQLTASDPHSENRSQTHTTQRTGSTKQARLKWLAQPVEEKLEEKCGLASCRAAVHGSAHGVCIYFFSSLLFSPLPVRLSLLCDLAHASPLLWRADRRSCAAWNCKV